MSGGDVVLKGAYVGFFTFAGTFGFTLGDDVGEPADRVVTAEVAFESEVVFFSQGWIPGRSSWWSRKPSIPR